MLKAWDKVFKYIVEFSNDFLRAVVVASYKMSQIFDHDTQSSGAIGAKGTIKRSVDTPPINFVGVMQEVKELISGEFCVLCLYSHALCDIEICQK